MTTFGERIRSRREELKIASVAELARMAGGITRSALSQIENGITKDLSYKNTKAVAKALGVNPDWLAFGTGPKLESKLKDPGWVGQATPAQRELIETLRLYGPLLGDQQCVVLCQIIKGINAGEPVTA